MPRGTKITKGSDNPFTQQWMPFLPANQSHSEMSFPPKRTDLVHLIRLFLLLSPLDSYTHNGNWFSSLDSSASDSSVSMTTTHEYSLICKLTILYNPFSTCLATARSAS